MFVFFSFFFFGWTYPCECTGDDGCAQKGYRVGGDHHQTEEAASDGHCCWEEVVWNVDVSMKGEASVVVYSLGKLSLGRSLASQCLLLFWKIKSYLKLGGINSNTYARLNPCSPNWRHFNPCDEQSCREGQKILLFRRVLTKIVTHHHQLSIESMGMRCRTLIFRKAPHPQATANYRRSLLIAST